GRPRTDVIRQLESALPRVGHARAVERLEDLLRLAPRQRNRRDLRDALHLAGLQALALLGRAPARRLGIARTFREVLHAAALDGVVGPPLPARIDVVLREPVVGRIAVDDHRRRPGALGIADLEAAENLPVAHQRDAPAYVDPEFRELLE